MIAAYRSRRFQLWEYHVSHGSVLIRSPRGLHGARNVDLVFVGVEYIAVPRHLNGVVVEHGSELDVAVAREGAGDLRGASVFALVSGGQRHLIVAVACRVSENHDDIFDSPF